ncbi:hypothetical protein PBY51_018953 [Eleginops maclovinus]|uniref:Uncharacterized protein n=1 Tax=Eleginops maclovinus TaxID=56733 RepID=A0AAN7Y9C6_ELEMC|nr:hypothetical protein PBY51_018953 [Eleginops maclovinus]
MFLSKLRGSGGAGSWRGFTKRIINVSSGLLGEPAKPRELCDKRQIRESAVKLLISPVFISCVAVAFTRLQTSHFTSDEQ